MKFIQIKGSTNVFFTDFKLTPVKEPHHRIRKKRAITVHSSNVSRRWFLQPLHLYPIIW